VACVFYISLVFSIVIIFYHSVIHGLDFLIWLGQEPVSSFL